MTVNSCLMSTHKVIAVIITYATSGEKVNRETREDGGEWVVKLSRTFDLYEAGYEHA